MRKVMYFLLGMCLVLAIGQIAYGQDFTNLPDEMKGKITADNHFLYPFNATYIVLVGTSLYGERIYWVAYHIDSERILSAGYVDYGERSTPIRSKHWILNGVWESVSEEGEAEWLRANDVPEQEV